MVYCTNSVSQKTDPQTPVSCFQKFSNYSTIVMGLYLKEKKLMLLVQLKLYVYSQSGGLGGEALSAGV